MAHTCQRVGDDVRGHKSGQRKEEEVYERPEGTGAVDGDDSRHTDANVRCLAADAGASAEFQEDGAILIAPSKLRQRTNAVITPQSSAALEPIIKSELIRGRDTFDPSCGGQKPHTTRRTWW